MGRLVAFLYKAPQYVGNSVSVVPILILPHPDSPSIFLLSCKSLDLSPFQRQFPLFSIEYRFSSGLTDHSPLQRRFPLFSIEYCFSSGLTGHSTWAFQLLLLFSTSEVVCCSLQLR
ncbi:hypothetical protein ES288_D01G102800v1 [Gossypium darwinii]|uniref:Uncharacterized protein n=1 Tax=Gossypium darwinii TaxID=34276 RepID=A0A5D2DNH6_GOSDA|nr:hypothetical protein ES288_D01G102800v1 [Gossypium darwinii]